MIVALVTLRRLAVLLAALPMGVGAAEESGGQRPRDAAEAVREGDVQQWLKYYQREREREAQAPARQAAPREEPAAQQKQEDAAGKR